MLFLMPILSKTQTPKLLVVNKRFFVGPCDVSLTMSQHILCPLIETVAKTGMILLAGEVTSRANVDYQKIVRDTVRHIGYDDSSKGLCHSTGIGKNHPIHV